MGTNLNLFKDVGIYFKQFLNSVTYMIYAS